MHDKLFYFTLGVVAGVVLEVVWDLLERRVKARSSRKGLADSPRMARRNR